MTDTIQVGSYTLKSRLLVGTGKYRDLDETGRAIEASGADVVTMAVRRTNLGQNPNEPKLLDVISPDRYTLLPNTAGCHTADDAVRTCRLARELLDGHQLVKLEVISRSRTLYPDVVETLNAARILVNEGFEVMVYTSDDPLIAMELEAIGCVAVMPLGAPIGSGLGLQNPYNIREILDQLRKRRPTKPFGMNMDWSVITIDSTFKRLLAAKRRWSLRSVLAWATRC